MFIVSQDSRTLNLLRVMLLSLSLSSTRGFIRNAGVVSSSPLSALTSSGPSLLRYRQKISWRGHPRACPGGVQALSMVLFDLPSGREVISYYESTRPRVPGIIGRLLSRVVAPLAALWMFLLFLSIKVGVPPVRLLEYSGAAWTCRTPPQLIYRTQSLKAGTKNTLQPTPPMLQVQKTPKTAPSASETTNSPQQLPSTEATHDPEHELVHSPPADGEADGVEGQHQLGKAEAAEGEVVARQADDSAMPASPSVGTPPPLQVELTHLPQRVAIQNNFILQHNTLTLPHNTLTLLQITLNFTMQSTNFTLLHNTLALLHRWSSRSRSSPLLSWSNVRRGIGRV